MKITKKELKEIIIEVIMDSKKKYGIWITNKDYFSSGYLTPTGKITKWPNKAKLFSSYKEAMQAIKNAGLRYSSGAEHGTVCIHDVCV